MPAFEVLVTVNGVIRLAVFHHRSRYGQWGDPASRVVIIAADENAAITIVFDNRVACDTDMR
jgi:hypothetical protein